MLDPSKPWKIDVDILRSPQYESVSQGLLHCDEEDGLWLPVDISFDASRDTDAWTAVQTSIVLLSEDGGLTWEITDRPWPAPSHNHVVLSDGTIVEMGGTGWIRMPRTEIERLEAEGYMVWDLGEEHDYCAYINEVLVKVSRDGGQTWEERSIRDQLPFFAHFVSRGPLSLLDDGTLIFIAYGYGKDDRGSRWTRSYRGPYGPKLAVPPRGEKYNYPKSG